MFCTSCGNQIKDDASFCTKCGAPVIKTDEDSRTEVIINGPVNPVTPVSNNLVPPVVPPTTVPPVNTTQTKPKNNMIVIFALIGALLCAIAVGVLLYLNIDRIKSFISSKTGHETYREYDEDDEDEDDDDEDDEDEDDDEELIEEESEALENEFTEEFEGGLPAVDAYPEEDYEEYNFYFDDNYGIHDYDVIVEDVTWEEANEICIALGGYLVRINDNDEFNYISNMLISEGNKNLVVWLGGMYNDEDGAYHWYDYEYGLFDYQILESSYNWLSGEPSYYGENADGDYEQENYMDMFYSSKAGAFVWNDVPDDITQYYSGKIAFICEYE